MIKQIADNMLEELIQIRRELHKIPETAFEEYQTSQYIKDRLDEFDIPWVSMAKTGVVGLIQGNHPGKTLLIRADIDGLPITEESGVPFASERHGFMHACGHDVHVTCLLGAAKLLNSLKEQLHGNVKLVFQPAEEGVGGALPMIKEGVMENPSVDGAIALHVEPLEAVGNVQLKNGPVMASPDDFKLTVRGVGGHGASPHTCVDPILVGSMIVNAYQTIVSRHFDPMTPCVVSVCSFHSGSCTNAIPDTATLTGTARSLNHETRQKLTQLLEKIAVETAQSMGAACDFEFLPLYPPTINAPEMNDLIANACDLSGVKTVELERASMAGDDFAYFCECVPGSYFKLGVGNETAKYPIHSPKFQADENALPVGVAILAQAAVLYLS